MADVGEPGRTRHVDIGDGKERGHTFRQAFRRIIHPSGGRKLTVHKRIADGNAADQGEKRIEIKDKVESAGYINMTIDVLRSFGIKVRKEGNAITMSEGEKFSSPGVTVTEGDWSNSAFWLCGAAASGQEVTCRGLNMDSSQGDAAIAGILRDMGADVECSGSSVRVKAAGLKGIEIDAGDIPDLVPAIALAACTAEGVTRITNAGRLRVKESDRLFTVADTLRKLGADIEEGEDSLSVTGGRRLAGGSVDSHGDHRIVMMAAIASLLSEDSITIEGAGAVNKSYPGFFEDFASLGAEVERSSHELSLWKKHKDLNIRTVSLSGDRNSDRRASLRKEDRP